MLHFVREGETLRILPPHHVEALHLHGSAILTGPARRILLEQGTDVVFMTRDGRFLARLVGRQRARGDRRLAQYQCVCDPARRLTLARDVVVGKLRNQRQHLLQRGIPAQSAGPRGLSQAMDGASSAPSLESLRGAEGSGARAYFAVWDQLLRRDDFRFSGRSRQPPRDPVNAMLSYGYTLLVNRVDHAVHGVGLDPHLGVLHEAGRGAPCLALDLAEAWRPFVDSVILTLINRRQVHPSDFRRPTQEEVGDQPDAVWMDRTAKTILVRAWEKRLRGPALHPMTGERWMARSLFREQVTQIATAFNAVEPRYHSVEL